MYEVESCIHGFHVYRTVWTSYIGEQLDSGSENPIALAVQKDGEAIRCHCRSYAAHSHLTRSTQHLCRAYAGQELMPHGCQTLYIQQ